MCLFGLFETEFGYVVQAGFELVAILLPQSQLLECWDYSRVPPCPTLNCFFLLVFLTLAGITYLQFCVVFLGEPSYCPSASPPCTRPHPLFSIPSPRSLLPCTREKFPRDVPLDGTALLGAGPSLLLTSACVSQVWPYLWHPSGAGTSFTLVTDFLSVGGRGGDSYL